MNGHGDEHHNAEHHNAEHHNAEHHNFGYDPGYPQADEGEFDNAYDRVTARDIADLLHQASEQRGHPGAGITSIIGPAERAAFLFYKAELFTRIADQAEQTEVTIIAKKH